VESYDINILRRYVCEKMLKGKCLNKPILIAPLPSVFKSNILAYKELLRLKNLMNKDVIIVVTGIKEASELSPQDNIIPIGYVSYTSYIALLLSADGVILPYPSNAICGGARNKVLEAGFCKKPLISTRAGVMHARLLPNVHYITIDSMEVVQSLKSEKLQETAKKLGKLIREKYSFTIFKKLLLKLFKATIS
jgi:glycosyltransferase involved in cell wall biosynthesis